MDAAGVFRSHYVLRFPKFPPFSQQCYLGKSSLSLKEVAVGISPFVPQNQFGIISNIKCDGNKGVQSHEGKPASRRTEKGDENKRPPRTFDGKKSKSSDQQEIIDLLRRIQISISKGDSQGTIDSASVTTTDKDRPSAGSILDVLRQSGKPVEGDISKGAREKGSTKTRGVSRKVKEVEKHPQETDFKLTRLPSSFVRKSPISSLSALRGEVLELKDEEDKQVQTETRLEKMKLQELKELAKFRKIKGYSKLNKGQLIEILGVLY